jgi:hypothetical protein
MVSNSKTDYNSTASSEYEPPMITVGDKDIKVIIEDKNNRNTPTSERNIYKLDQDPVLAGSREPVNLAFCPHCSKEGARTRTKTYPNIVTWTCVAVGAVVFFPICWVPLVVDKMKKTDHYCQNCEQKLGSIKPFEGVGIKERL